MHAHGIKTRAIVHTYRHILYIRGSTEVEEKDEIEGEEALAATVIRTSARLTSLLCIYVSIYYHKWSVPYMYVCMFGLSVLMKSWCIFTNNMHAIV